MATHQAIAATSAALLGLMQDQYPRELFGASLDFQALQAKDFDTGLATDGFSLLLYRVSVTGSVRNLGVRRDGENRRFRPSLPVDLHYLLSAWAADAQTQQRMLGWAMRFLEDLGALGAGRLNHYVQEVDIFGPEEGLEVVCDPLALGDYLNLWDKLKPRMPTSMTYLVRMLTLDSQQRLEDGALVQARQFGMAVPA